MNAWARAYHLSLGQVAVAAEFNKIPPSRNVDRHGALVTIGAMGCQKAIAAKIVDRVEDNVLTAKRPEDQAWRIEGPCLASSLHGVEACTTKKLPGFETGLDFLTFPLMNSPCRPGQETGWKFSRFSTRMTEQSFCQSGEHGVACGARRS